MPTIAERPSRPRSRPEARSERPGSDKLRGAPTLRILIPFGTPYLYGMERAVIETFDALRPEVEPEFLVSTMAARRRRPVILEIERRGFSHSFLPDTRDWPMPCKPRSLRQAWDLLVALTRGSLATLRSVVGCDALYVPTPIAVTSLPAAVYCRITGKRVIYQFHDLNPPAWLVRIWKPVVSVFVHNTEYGREHVLRSYPFLKKRSHVVAPPITQISRLCDPDPRVRAELEGKRNLLFVGQLTYIKGFDLLLEAFLRLAPEYPDVHLQVLGKSSDEQQLRLTIASMGLESRVHLWGYREDVCDFFRMAFLYVQSSPPSRVQESFGRGTVEAMAQGVPTVCFGSGAQAEIVLNGTTGLICRDETPDCLAHNIRRFLEQIDFRDDCARFAKHVFQERYSKDKTRDRWIPLFQQGNCVS